MKYKCLTCTHPFNVHFAQAFFYGTYIGIVGNKKVKVPSWPINGQIRCRMCKGYHELNTKKGI